MNANEILRDIRVFLKDNEESRANVARMLISFKVSVRSQNKHIRKIEYNNNAESEESIIHLQNISKNLISYISIWRIYINQHLVSIKDFRQNLKGFIRQEATLLKPFLDAYVANRSSDYHYDALACQNLFEEVLRDVQ